MLKIIRKYIANLPVGVKSSFAFAFASMISAGMSYITTPIFTRLMTSHEYGEVSVFLTWQSILGIVAMFSLSYGVFNNGMMDYADDRDVFSFSLLGLSNVITIFTFFGVIILVFFLGDFIGISIKYLFVMFLVFLFQPAYNFWLARQRYEYKYKAALLATSIVAIVAPIISVITVIKLADNKVDARIFGLELSLLCIYIYFYLFLAKKAKWKINKHYWKIAFYFNLPLLPHYLSTYILSSSDKIMISNIVGSSATGYYSVAYSIASLGIIIWSAINGSLIPFTYEKCKNKDYEKIKKIINPIIIMIFSCCIMVILIAPEVMSFLASGEYAQSVVVVPTVVGGIFFQVQYSLYANILYYYRKPKWVMISSIITAFLNIILNYIFISKFGYIAAGYTTMVCYLIQAIIDCIVMYRVVNDFVYDVKLILILSITMLFIAVFGALLYRNFLMRCGIFVLMVIEAFLNREYFIKIMKSIKQ